jgi:hypothetical protein
MPPIRTDLSAGGGFEVKPAGDYEAAVFSFKRGTSNGAKTKGATSINVRFKLTDGGSVFDTYYLHPATMWRFKQFLIAAGIPGDDFAGDATIGYADEFEGYEAGDDETIVHVDDLLERVQGQLVTVRLKVDPQRTNPDTGEIYDERNRIDRVLPAGVTADTSSGW